MCSTDITWKQGRNITLEPLAPASGASRVPRPREPASSFFHFFGVDRLCRLLRASDEEREDIVNNGTYLLESSSSSAACTLVLTALGSVACTDLMVGLAILEDIIPNAVRWYNGMAAVEYLAEIEEDDTEAAAQDVPRGIRAEHDDSANAPPAAGGRLTTSGGRNNNNNNTTIDNDSQTPRQGDAAADGDNDDDDEEEDNDDDEEDHEAMASLKQLRKYTITGPVGFADAQEIGRQRAGEMPTLSSQQIQDIKVGHHVQVSRGSEIFWVAVTCIEPNAADTWSYRFYGTVLNHLRYGTLFYKNRVCVLATSIFNVSVPDEDNA